MKKIGADAILMAIISPVAIWLISFIMMSYKTEAEVQTQKTDIQSIKEDVRYIRNYLLEKK